MRCLIAEGTLELRNYFWSRVVYEEGLRAYFLVLEDCSVKFATSLLGDGINRAQFTGYRCSLYSIEQRWEVLFLEKGYNLDPVLLSVFLLPIF